MTISKLGNKLKEMYESSSGKLLFIFSTFATLLLISPLLLKVDKVKELTRCFLEDTGSYSGDYISTIGGLIGTGLAVSSALWISETQERKSNREIQNKMKKQKILTYKRIERYLKRELRRLWTIWLWVTFDLSIYFDREKEYPYEPYSIDLSQVLNDFIDIEKDISEKTIETFYELFFFSEKINYLVNTYNVLRTDTVTISSFPNPYGSSISLQSDVNQSQSSYKIFESIKILINEKKLILFNEDSANIEEQIDILRNSQYKWSKFNDLKKEIAKKIANPKEKTNDFLLKYYNEEKEVESWLNGTSQIPDGFVEDVEKLKSLKQDISNYEDSYEKIKKDYLLLIDNPLYSNKITELIDEIETKTNC